MPTERPATYTLQEAADAIMGEEANGWVFKDCRITGAGAGRRNEVDFELDPQGMFPTACVLQLAADPVPDAHTLAWKGRMLIEDAERDVWIYRAN
jgi:hypothetical protein